MKTVYIRELTDRYKGCQKVREYIHSLTDCLQGDHPEVSRLQIALIRADEYWKGEANIALTHMVDDMESFEKTDRANKDAQQAALNPKKRVSAKKSTSKKEKTNV